MSTYRIQSGDTLSHIASRTGHSVAQLAQLNGIQNVDLIHAGQKLNIPGQRDQYVGGASAVDAAAPGSSAKTSDALSRARGLVGRAYGDPAGASGEAVGPDSPFMHCAQFVNAVYPDLPPRAPELTQMAQRGRAPKAGDVVASREPAPWGHVGIMTEKGTILHSIPGRGVHESSMADFETYSPIVGVIPR